MNEREVQAKIEIRREDITSAIASSLIQASNAELSTRYPEEGANHFRLEPDEVVEGRGAFLVGYDRGEPVGCGAIRRLDAETAEIKRMYVIPSRRGYGVGRAVLAALEAEGCRLGVGRLVLEPASDRRRHSHSMPRPVFSGFRCLASTSDLR